MKIAFACWSQRIAPVFDTARQIHVVAVEAGQIVSEMQETLPEGLLIQKTLRLVEIGIGALVCGAISRPFHAMIASYGIQVVPFIAGDLQEVMDAWLKGSIENDVYAMPGCCGHGGRRVGRMHGSYQEANTMNGRGRGMSGGGGKGQGQGGSGRGRMGGSKASGPAGLCVCLQCGQTEPHERGVPCVERKCPKCGASMARQ